MPLYIIAQMLGSVLGSATLCALFPVDKKSFFGTVPVGSNLQSLLVEIIISFLLMFVISGVSTDNRAVSNFYLLFLPSASLICLLLCAFDLVRFENWRIILLHADWRVGRNCCGNDNNLKRLCCRVLSICSL